MPGTKHSINVSFQPKNMGVFNNTMDLKLLNGVYTIPIRLMGSSNQIQSKEVTKRGPDAVSEDFIPQRNFIDEKEIEIPNKKRGTVGEGMPKFLQESTTLQLETNIKMDNTEKIDQYLMIRQNKQKFNDYVKNERQFRDKEKKMIEKMKQTSKPPPQTFEEMKDDLDIGLDNFKID